MDNEKRLENLAKKISSTRSQGRVRFWPEAIRKEIVYLIEIFGLKIVAQKTNMYVSFLCHLQKRQKKDTSIGRNKAQIQVTRISVNPIKSFEPKPQVFASFIKDKVEFKIYCKDVADKIAERFFL